MGLHLPLQGNGLRPWDDRAYVPQALNPRAAAAEALPALEPGLCRRRSLCNKKPTHHNWGGAPAHCSWRTPTQSSRDTVQPKIIKYLKPALLNKQTN